MSAAPDTNIYIKLRSATDAMRTAFDAMNWATYTAKTRLRWNEAHPSAPQQRLVTSEEMAFIRESLSNAIDAIVGVRAHLSVEDLDPLRAAVRIAKEQLSDIEELIGGLP